MSIIEQLKDIYYEKKSASYIGETLYLFNEEENKLVLKLVNQGVNEEENFWIAMNYIKYKTPEWAFYKKALKVAMKKEDMLSEISKMLLEKEIDD